MEWSAGSARPSVDPKPCIKIVKENFTKEGGTPSKAIDQRLSTIEKVQGG